MNCNKLAMGGALVLAALCSPVRAQQTSRLRCAGVMGNVRAVLSGVRQYNPFAGTDGYVRFAGKVSAGGITGNMTYEGYTATGAFRGRIVTSGGELSIGVLDNTGGKMIIYGGRPTLGPPDILGQFVCQWQ